MPLGFFVGALLLPASSLAILTQMPDELSRKTHALHQRQDEFISTVSHELRTPLTSLRGALGLLMSGAITDPAKARKMMEIALSNTDRLIRLVNDMLDLERIGSGQEALHTGLCDVEELMQRAVASLEVDAAAAQLNVTVQAAGVYIHADADRILQTLINLLSNAIKFSPPGRDVRLSAHVDGQQALLQVQDSGRGIPEDKLEAIFERFHQVDATDARSKGGTGLGLAICRSIIAQHGGRIWATSTLGHGSTFHIALPAHAA